MTIDTRRHILFIIPSLRGGGSERVIVTLLRFLDRAKFRLTLAVVDMRGNGYHEDVPEDIELLDLHCHRVRYAVFKIMYHVWTRRPAIVFSTLGHLNLILAMIRPLLPDSVRYIARESSIVSENSKNRWVRLLYKLYYHRFDDVVCQSHYMKDDLVDNYRFPLSKSVVINNPVDTERISRLASDALPFGFERGVSGGMTSMYLVAAGRLSHEKGFDLLIEALAICNNPSIQLVILGEGPLRGELERLTVAKGLTTQIKFAGFQSNPYPFFARADAFVLSSHYEGFPNVILEALACGTPVIATPAPGGVREILEKISGCVITEDISAEALARAIQSFSYGERILPDAVAPYKVADIVKRYELEFA